jgi:hypothetical protein
MDANDNSGQKLTVSCQQAGDQERRTSTTSEARQEEQQDQ